MLKIVDKIPGETVDYKDVPLDKGIVCCVCNNRVSILAPYNSYGSSVSAGLKAALFSLNGDSVHTASSDRKEVIKRTVTGRNDCEGNGIQLYYFETRKEFFETVVKNGWLD